MIHTKLTKVTKIYADNINFRLYSWTDPQNAACNLSINTWYIVSFVIIQHIFCKTDIGTHDLGPVINEDALKNVIMDAIQPKNRDNNVVIVVKFLIYIIFSLSDVGLNISRTLLPLPDGDDNILDLDLDDARDRIVDGVPIDAFFASSSRFGRINLR